MLVAIHQPHYLPWLGYLDRMREADLFIVLDHVQFERRNYQNRTRILFDGISRWLTVPVIQHSQLERIVDKRIDNRLDSERKWWGTRQFNMLRHAYRDAPYFDVYAPRLLEIMEARHDRLVDLDSAMLDFLRELFNINTPLINSSELPVPGQRSELILNLLKEVGADTYFAGMGGSRSYLNLSEFEAAGIDIRWQNFRHPVYSQCGGGPFVPGLSAIDLLFNHGPESRHVLLGDVPEPYVADVG
jgi:hypothetical protein